MAQQLTSTEVNRVVTLREEGHSQLMLPNSLELCRKLWKLWKRYRKTGTVTRRAGTGPKSKTTTGDERFLRLQALRNRTHTARNLQKHLVRTRRTRISDQTVCNRLREAELRARN
jgi:hypothetical protein